MPVLGHAFVGFATAREFHPARRRTSASPAELASWTSLIVVLAYLPEVITQFGLLVGWPHAGVAGHSVLIGTAVCAVVCLVWSRAVGAPARAALTIGIATVLLHDTLDILVATDRAPFWPLSKRLAAGGLRLWSPRISELVLFGV